MKFKLVLLILVITTFLSQAQVHNQNDTIIDGTVYTLVEEPAAYPGGVAGFYDYLGKNVKYPRLAARSGTEGRVFVQFIVEKDGTISNVDVVKGIGSGCDEEALRVMKMMPKWKPGKTNGEPARQKLVQVIEFKLTKAKKTKKRNH
ncbi:MAG: energy transducer TonB [Bacteroidota bacterium]